MTSKHLRIGIVGCGGIARAHLGAYRHDSELDIVSVCDVSTEAARKLAAECGARVARSPLDMALTDHLDAVSICTPPGMHFEVALPFVRAKIPVLCEKPLEADIRRARKLADEVHKHKALFMTAYCHRFHPGIIELKKLIKEGKLGKPVFFRNIFGGYLKLKGNHRALPDLSGGGCVIDNCSHSVDLFRFLVGEPTEIQAMTGAVTQHEAVEDIGLLHLYTAKKAYGEITSSYSLPVCGNWVEWYGTQGTAVVSYWNTNQPDLTYKQAGQADWVTVDCSHLPDRFTAEVAHFLDCVRTKHRPAITVLDGLQTSIVIAAAYKSAKMGKRISLI